MTIRWIHEGFKILSLMLRIFFKASVKYVVKEVVMIYMYVQIEYNIEFLINQ